MSIGTDFSSADASFDQAMFLAGQYKKSSPTMDASSLERIDKSAKDFESVFVSQMLSNMYGETGSDNEFNGGYGEDMFRSMVIDQYGKKIEEKGGIGLADSIRKQLIEIQEKQSQK